MTVTEAEDQEKEAEVGAPRRPTGRRRASPGGS